MIFYTGTHQASWLWKHKGNWCVSRRRLYKKKKLHKALDRWVLDSGGFTELNDYGKWTVEPKAYVLEVERYISEIKNIEWCATQDWMCEDFVLKKTKKSVLEHQLLTIRSFLDLKNINDKIPWLPVIQGYTREEYLTCIDLYQKAGIDLTQEKCVGLGSICRRQITTEAADIISEISDMGIKLHGFGLKSTALKDIRVRSKIASSDSLAWSFEARYNLPLQMCKTHESCSSCIHYARLWTIKIHLIIAGLQTLHIDRLFSLRRSEMHPVDRFSKRGDQLNLFNLKVNKNEF